VRAPELDRTTAATVLALIAAARAHEPEAPLAWLVGYAQRASGEPLALRVDPRVEAPEGQPIARVPLVRREQR
jgi:hypothetical protein